MIRVLSHPDVSGIQFARCGRSFSVPDRNVTKIFHSGGSGTASFSASTRVFEVHTDAVRYSEWAFVGIVTSAPIHGTLALQLSHHGLVLVYSVRSGQGHSCSSLKDAMTHAVHEPVSCPDVQVSNC